ncbi:MAG TPA: hypothetical protein PLX56_00985 [bacterium]|nr:hypothetical protein [bacterium]
MLIKTIACLFIVLGFFSTVSSKELELDSSHSFWNVSYRSSLMFGNLLDEEGKCLDVETGSTYTLNATFLPPDAYVMKAFLVWTGAQPIDKIDELADNEVILNFKSEDGKIEKPKTVTATGYKVSQPQGFEFDSFVDGDSGKAYFTYRVDVTDFFKTLHEKGQEFGNYNDGESLFGDYTVSGLDCSDDEIYLENNRNVSNWAIALVYSSYSFSRRSILFLDGLHGYEPGSEIDPDGPVSCPTDASQDPNCTMLSNHGVDPFYFNHQILNWTLTNLLISHMDAPSSNFDIPDQPELVACTPANIPLDPDNPDSFWCPSGEHTFAIRIQNWGNSDAEKIVVKAEIPKGMEYIKGTTEYADEFFIENEKKIARKRIIIPDVDGKFPLSEGLDITEITGKLSPCPEDSNYLSCKNFIIIRFKAKIKDSTPKHSVIESSANIETYNSNQGIPLKLRLSTTDCPNHSYPEDVFLDDCGGLYYDWTRYCSTNEQCWEGECCSFEVVAGKGVCVTGPCNLSDDDVLNDDDNQYDDNQYDDAISSVNDSDTETSEKDNSFGCGCSII